MTQLCGESMPAPTQKTELFPLWRDRLCSKDIPIAIGIVGNESLVFQIKFSRLGWKSSALRVAAKRFLQGNKRENNYSIAKNVKI